MASILNHTESTSTRTAIVTGAGMGLGRAIAMRLSSDGLNVVVNDLPSKEAELSTLVAEIEQGGGHAVMFVGDVSMEENVKSLVAKSVEVFGGLDVMVANAGTAIIKPIIASTLEDLDHIFSTNFRSVWLSYRYAAEQMIKQGRGGRIVGASSATGKKGYPLMSLYSASKFAVRGLTQSAAQEWGPHGITVNAYCPGIIWTPLIQSLGKDLRGVVAQTGTDPKEMWAKSAAMGRVGDPKDVASMVSWLVSEETSFVTGQSVLIDGGVQFD